jgi:hypothetical protein
MSQIKYYKDTFTPTYFIGILFIVLLGTSLSYFFIVQVQASLKEPPIILLFFGLPLLLSVLISLLIKLSFSRRIKVENDIITIPGDALKDTIVNTYVYRNTKSHTYIFTFSKENIKRIYRVSSTEEKKKLRKIRFGLLSQDNVERMFCYNLERAVCIEFIKPIIFHNVLLKSIGLEHPPIEKIYISIAESNEFISNLSNQPKTVPPLSKTQA